MNHAVAQTRFLARQLGARVWVGSDQILAVDGKPHWGALHQGMRAALAMPEDARELHPAHFGYSQEALSELSFRGLAGRARALKRWSRDLEDARLMRGRDDRRGRDFRGPDRGRGRTGRDGRPVRDFRSGRDARPGGRDARPGKTSKVSAEDQREVEGLSARLDRLHRLLEGKIRPRGAERYLAPLAASSGRSPAAPDGDSPLGWLAGICAWIGGPRAVGRFLDCVRGCATPPSPEHAAAIAALAAVDECDEPLPSELFEGADADEGRWLQRVAAFARETRHPGYAYLLDVQRRASGRLRDPWTFPSQRRLLEEGARTDDLRWIVENAPSALLPLAHARRVPLALRKLVETLRARGTKLPTVEVEAMALAHERRYVAQLFERGFELLEGLPRRAFTPRSGREFWSLLLGAETLARISDPFRGQLADWAHPPRRREEMEGRPEGLHPDAGQAVNLLAHYQLLAGHEPRPSKTLQRLFDGWADDPGAERANRITRKASRLAVIAALQALRHRLQHESKRLARKLWHLAVPETVSEESIARVAIWAAELNHDDSRRLDRLFTAWGDEGAAWRKALPGNRDWLREAKTRNCILDRWLDLPAEVLEGPWGRLRVEGPRHPWDVLTMGDPFRTCLRLDGGSQNRALLANAMDANKNLLLLRDEEGRLLGRKLLAIGSSGTLLGYRSHLLVEEGREELRRALHDYCARLACSCALTLGDLGRPEPLCAEFWYDEGPERWLPTARFEGEGRKADCGESWWKEMGERHGKQLVERAARRGLEILPKSRTATEELLADLARVDGSIELAESLAERAETPTGLVSALGACLLHRGDEGIDGYERNLPREEWALARGAQELVALGTSRALRTVCNWVLREETPRLDSSWLPIVAARSARGAREVEESLHSFSHRSWEPEFAVASCLCGRRQGKEASDATLLRLADIALREGPGSDWLGAWMPPLARPGKELTRKGLKEWLDTGRASWWSLPIEMGTTFLAQKNRGPDSAGFLRDRAEACPGALLAMALTAPRRFDRFLERRVGEWTARPAAALAGLVGLGERRARKILGARFDATRKLHGAIEALDLPTMESLLEGMAESEAARCAPLFVDVLERNLTVPDTGTPCEAAPLRSGLWSALSPVSLAVRLAARGAALPPKLAPFLEAATGAANRPEAHPLLLTLALRPEGVPEGNRPIDLGSLLGRGILGELGRSQEKDPLSSRPFLIEGATSAGHAALLPAEGEKARELLETLQKSLAPGGKTLAELEWIFEIEALQAKGVDEEAR